MILLGLLGTLWEVAFSDFNLLAIVEVEMEGSDDWDGNELKRVWDDNGRFGGGGDTEDIKGCECNTLVGVDGQKAVADDVDEGWDEGMEL